MNFLKRSQPVSKHKVSYPQNQSNTIINVYMSSLNVALKYVQICRIIACWDRLGLGVDIYVIMILIDYFPQFAHISGEA